MRKAIHEIRGKEGLCSSLDKMALKEPIEETSLETQRKIDNQITCSPGSNPNILNTQEAIKLMSMHSRRNDLEGT